MNESCRKMIPFDSSQVELLQCWLEEQAKEGWELNHISLGILAIFKHTANHRLKYGFGLRMAGMPAALSDQKREEYRLRGWDYTAAYGDLYILKKNHTDQFQLPEDEAVWNGYLQKENRLKDEWLKWALPIISLAITVIAFFYQVNIVQILMAVATILSTLTTMINQYLERKGRHIRPEERLEKLPSYIKTCILFRWLVLLGAFAVLAAFVIGAALRF